MLNIKKNQGRFFGKFPRSVAYGIIHILSTAIISEISSEELKHDLNNLLGANPSVLAAYDLPYGAYSTSDTWLARQFLALYTKNADLADKNKLFDDAIGKFMETEETCRSINEAFANNLSGHALAGYERELFIARRKIAEILGDCPEIKDLNVKFGPGASTVVKIKTTARHKLNAPIVCSRESVNSVKELMETLPYYAYAHRGVTLISAGYLSAVAKSAVALRTILIEPHLNTAVQKGIGDKIRDCLSFWGIDLRNQEINRNKARQASIDGLDATVDLKSASDTIACLLVSNLFPLPWVELMSSWRTGSIWLPDAKKGQKVHLLEKFSSMGNGFTFELESLIFYALTYAVCVSNGISTHSISVYGDDIICPVEAIEPLNNLFAACGFSINLKKSYASGHFRESCGGDFFFGQNVRPFYVRDRLSNGSLVAFHNYLDNLIEKSNDELLNHNWRDCQYTWVQDIKSVIRKLQRVCLRSLTMKVPYGPHGYGDGHLTDSIIWDLLSSSGAFNHRKDEVVSYSFYTYQKVDRESREPLQIGDDLYPQYSIYLNENCIEENSKPLWYISSKEHLRKLALHYRQSLPAVLGLNPYVIRNIDGFKAKLTRVRVGGKPRGILDWEAIPEPEVILASYPAWVADLHKQKLNKARYKQALLGD